MVVKVPVCPEVRTGGDIPALEDRDAVPGIAAACLSVYVEVRQAQADPKPFGLFPREGEDVLFLFDGHLEERELLHLINMDYERGAVHIFDPELFDEIEIREYVRVVVSPEDVIEAEVERMGGAVLLFVFREELYHFDGMVEVGPLLDHLVLRGLMRVH